ncbi:MAG: phage integrase N-terminal domain-containing protein [Rhodocyclaceae bacterium]|jgi:integrase|nr:phage integrase N-terminal domain-containing protein [Rhodocyclaceae bacterium]
MPTKTPSPVVPDSVWRKLEEQLGWREPQESNDSADDFDFSGDAMRDLNYQLKQLCHRNRDGSFATQSERERTLALVATQLHELGFRNLSAQGLKPKHVEALVNRWSGEKLSAGTIKNRMAHLRWWAEKLGKANIVARSNDAYGIADRRFVTNVSKAVTLQEAQLELITDTNSRLSLELQAAFGLRRAESIKFNASFADRGDILVLKASWCKGGKEREIPIRTAGQRALLDAVRDKCGKGSLIPGGMTYKAQLDRFKHQCSRAGIHGVHGLRHSYAQARYLELTGWRCPAQGGPTSRQLTPEQKAADRAARLEISRELGHEREAVTAIYLGR